MNVKIYYKNKQKVHSIKGIGKLVSVAVQRTLEFEKIDESCEVSVTYVDNNEIHRMNREYRNVDRPTDVLSFPMYTYTDDDYPIKGQMLELGDIVISLEKAKEQSLEYGHSFDREVTFLTVHSVLHLLGYDHETNKVDEREMFERQDKIMELIGLTR